ncbi:hypothetical protein HWV62_31369 [Athelia sp. TMB]|nr:hypothetical protein HWV62_31369 [Athelia sp. TMB]
MATTGLSTPANDNSSATADTFYDWFVCNPKLQVFSIHSLQVNGRQGSRFPRLLAKVTTPSIRIVIVGLRMRHVDDLDKLQWEEVDDVLERPNYSRLQKFVIGFEDHIFGVGAMEWIQDTFPRAFERGIIKVARLDEEGNISPNT